MYRYRQGHFAAIPGAPWVYWITPSLRALFKTLPNLGEVASPKSGMATTDNFRFLRFWWEVGSSKIERNLNEITEAYLSRFKWFPYMKGGNFKRWWGNQEHVVNWFKDGEEVKSWNAQRYINWSRKIVSPEFYFRSGVTYSYLTTGSFSARLSPGGFIFDVAGSSLFPSDISLVLAILNSTFAAYALKLINPTVNFQVGDLARLPVPTAASVTLHTLVEQAVILARIESAEDETTYEFVAPPTWSGGEDDMAARAWELTEVERQIDEEIYSLYDISAEDRQAIEAELAEPAAMVMDDAGENSENEPFVEDNRTISNDDTASDASTVAGGLKRQVLAARWVSYAVGIVLGRFQPGY